MCRELEEGSQWLGVKWGDCPGWGGSYPPPIINHQANNFNKLGENKMLDDSTKEKINKSFWRGVDFAQYSRCTANDLTNQNIHEIVNSNELVEIKTIKNRTFKIIPISFGQLESAVHYGSDYMVLFDKCGLIKESEIIFFRNGDVGFLAIIEQVKTSKLNSDNVVIKLKQIHL